MKFSDRTRIIEKSRIEESLEILEKNPEIISLGAGEPDFPAPKNVVEYAKKVLEKSSHYTTFEGKTEVREEIVKKLKKENKIDASPDEILLTTGSKEAIFLATLAFISVGDEAVVPDPGYLAYRPMVKVAGGIPISWRLKEEDKFEFHPEELKKIITEKTRLIYLNTPANPTGSVTKKKILEEIADVIVEKDLIAVSDEAYEKLVYDNQKHVSIAGLNGMNEYIVTTQTFSKSYAMCGYRIGYAVSSEKIIKEMREFKLVTTLSPPTLSQLVAIEALKKSSKYIEKMRKEYDRRRKMLIKRVNQMPNISCVKPEGAFYAFPNITGLKMSSRKVSDLLLERAKVLVIPGNDFGKYGEGYIRLSFATAYEKIEKAMDRIEKTLRIF